MNVIEFWVQNLCAQQMEKKYGREFVNFVFFSRRNIYTHFVQIEGFELKIDILCFEQLDLHTIELIGIDLGLD